MPLTLKAWLAMWRRRSAYSRCFEACRDGVARFPELRAVVGVAMQADPTTIFHVLGVHCWLVDAVGEVIDPTAHQYLDRAKLPISYWPMSDLPDHPEQHQYDARFWPTFPAEYTARWTAIEDWACRETAWRPRQPVRRVAA